MSDTILGVIIGGVIGFIPAIVSRIFSTLDLKKQIQRDLQLKQMEIFGKERIDALLAYSRRIGAFSAGTLAPEFNLDLFFASAEKASCFVTPETRALIMESMLFFGNRGHFTSSDVPAITDMQLKVSKAIADEIATSYTVLNRQ